MDDEEETTFFSSLRNRVGWTRDEPEPDFEEESYCLDLTFKERIIGFLVTYLFGILCSVLSWLKFGDLKAFGILMTTGNLCSIGGTLFLMGPEKQFKRMFDASRVVATTVLLVSMVGTFVAALVLKSGLLTFLCSGAQYLALIWYSLSYIPYARSLVLKFLGLCWGRTQSALDEPI